MFFQTTKVTASKKKFMSQYDLFFYTRIMIFIIIFFIFFYFCELIITKSYFRNQIEVGSKTVWNGKKLKESFYGIYCLPLQYR